MDGGEIMEKEKTPVSPQELHNREDEEAVWQDKDRWDTTDYAYISGWDYLVPDMDEEMIEDLQRYAG